MYVKKGTALIVKSIVWGPLCVYLAGFLVFLFAGLIWKGDVSWLLNSPLMSPVLSLLRKLNGIFGRWMLLLPSLWSLVGMMFCGMFYAVFDIDLFGKPSPAQERLAEEAREEEERKKKETISGAEEYERSYPCWTCTQSGRKTCDPGSHH